MARTDKARPARRPDSSPRRHPTDAVSLVVGIVFCGIALTWLLFEVGALTAGDLGWAVPVLLIGSGLVGLVASRTRRRG